MKRAAAFVGLGLLALSLLGVSSAATLPLAGHLDRTFGSAGVVTHTLGSNESAIRDIAVQADGKILAAASGSLVRYLPDGSLDSSFGDGGYVATAISADAVALQPDGKIVVAGGTGPVSDSDSSEFAVARYNSDGSPDTSFGTNGVTKTVIPETMQCGGGWGAAASALAILGDGDIVAAGSVTVYDCYFPESSWWVLTRYTSDGSLEPTFGDAGVVQTAFFGQDALSAIAVQPDGKLVATGSGEVWGHGGLDIATMALARYEPDGSLDPSFGDNGEATTDPQLYYYGGPTAFQHGKILVAGAKSKNGYSWFPVLARYDANGILDSSFGRLGVAEVKRRLGAPTAMVAQSDGKILISEGSSSLVRLLPNGRLDSSFGRGGIASLPQATSSLALQADGKVLAGGGSGNVWTLARLVGGNNCVVPVLRG